MIVLRGIKMKKYKTIPQGFMTVGEVAKKMNISVRTLQYYDQEKLLSPSSLSEGGLRLYTDKDLIKLHQVLSLKYLGFSLEEIKHRLVSLNTPEDVADALTKQALLIKEKIDALSDSLNAVKTLKTEVLQMQSVDFKKYADIIVNLQLKNENYWLIKHFDDSMLDYFRSHFNKDSALAFFDKFNKIRDTVVIYHREHVSPESISGQNLAKEFWNLLMEFTGGDMNLFYKLKESVENVNKVNIDWKQQQDLVTAFLEPALEAYFKKIECDPFQEVLK